CLSVCPKDDHREVLIDASGLRQDHLADNPSVALVTQDKCEMGLVLQNAQTLFGRVSQKDCGTAVVEDLFEQRSGVGIGRDEQYDRRMHMILASPRTTNYWKQPTPLPAKRKGGVSMRFGPLTVGGGFPVQFPHCEGGRSVWLV